MDTDIIARGMAGVAKKGGVVTKEKVVGALGYTPTYVDDESNGSSESTYSSEKIIEKISEVESWTGTKAEWEALDKSTLVDSQQINITDDEETVLTNADVEKFTADLNVAVEKAEAAKTDCENIKSELTDYNSPLFIKPTADGSNITVEDSSNAPIQRLRIYGRSTQDGTPTPESPIDIISINNPIITISDNAENTQSVTIPHVLCGLPVSSGGNYTDNTGQQWVCDTLTVNADGNGELVQKVGLEVLSDATASIIPDSDKIFTIKKSTTGYLQGKASLTQYRLLCSHFSTSEKQYVSASSPNNSMSWSGSPAQQLRVCSSMGAAALNELLGSGNVVLQYILAAPITVTLSPEEVKAILALNTYKSLTNIYNDQSADMSITYVADIKNYIDNKFNELSVAIVSSASEEE